MERGTTARPGEKDEEKNEKRMPILVMQDDRSHEPVICPICAAEGIGRLRSWGFKKQVIEQLGRKKVLMKSDNEPAICLQDLVRKETDIEIAMEEAHVGDHQASGVARGSSGP